MNTDKAFVDPALVSKIHRKQTERKESFAKLKKECVFDECVKEIVQLPVELLLHKLQAGEVTPTQVLQAYTAKALEVTEKFNCVTEFIPKAKEWAANLDGKEGPLGPLHGLPVAIKEELDVEGMDSTLGFAKNLYRPVKESSALVKVLLELGAVPFCKTNVPQSLFCGTGDNPVFGTTVNCRNPNLSAGGSSSGSGCIVGAGGAPFATGSDIGGSLRIPAHFNGVCSVRPTINRLSGKGMPQCIPKIVGIPGVPGIIAPDVATLTLVWRAITEDAIQNKYDPLAVPVPWNERLFASTNKLRIGYFTSLPFFPTFDETQKTVVAAKAALEARGHQLVPFKMPDDFQYMKLIMDVFHGDHGKGLEECFAGEPISPCVQGLVDYIRTLLDFQGSGATTEREKAFYRGGVDIKTAGDFWNVIDEQRKVKQDILERMNKAGLDLLLSPVWPCPAVKQEQSYDIAGVVYTAIWNCVDFPAGVIPFGVESQSGYMSYEDQNDPMLRAAKKAVSESVGMPIGVQIIGRPFKEELVLKGLMELEKSKMKQ